MNINSSMLFEKITGWPSFVAMRRIGGSAFQESITQLEIGSNGIIWALHKTNKNPDIQKDQKYIERYNTQGKLTLSLPEQKGTKTHSFVVHPSGNLTVLELRTSTGNPNKSNLWLKRIKPNGSIITESALRDGGLAYQEYDDIDMLRVHPFYYSAQLHVHGEDVYLLAQTQGMKLYRFKEDLKLLWNRQVLPYTSLLDNLDIKLAHDELSNIYAVVRIYDESEIKEWERYFGKTLPMQSKKSNFFIASFGSNGDPIISRVFGENHYLSIAGFVVKNGILTAGCHTRYDKQHNDLGSTLAWNIVFFRAEINSGKLLRGCKKNQFGNSGSINVAVTKV
ncbi:MAG: hypothetical protein KC505_11310 [Myxococcales bacterium]|nr:hypothetical protein [Myxococcales bacterium]